MKLLITGANGFMANHLLHYLKNKSYTLYSLTKNKPTADNCFIIENFEADITNNKNVTKVIDTLKPNVVVHCAAMSKPDDCENNKEICWQTNVEATKYLVKASVKYNAHFIFFSTDFVYGEGHNHKEEDEMKPLNFYAESKIAAENIVKETTSNYTIIRPVLIYGKEIEGVRKSFIQWVKESLELNKTIKVVNDQYRTPTFVNDICDAVENIISKNATGIYNIAGASTLTPYQMAVKVAQLCKLDESYIKAVTEADFKEPVKRAKRSILNIDKAEKELGFVPTDFDVALKKCF